MPGTKFSADDVANMLRFKTFTLGTILRHRQFGKFKVVKGAARSDYYQMKNSKYIATIGTSQRLKLTERPRLVYREVAA